VSTFQHVHLCDSDDSVEGSSIMDEAIEDDSVEGSSIMDEAIEEGWVTDYGLAEDNIMESGLVILELDVTKEGVDKYDIMIDSEDYFLEYLDNGYVPFSSTLQGWIISVI
jgi:hypothetical protein